MVKARNEMQRSFVEKTRLGIPVTFIMETLHSGGPDATIFPMPVNFAASWNVTAMQLAAQVIAAEARAVGTDRGFSPVVNMFPDARYGRVQEGYSEDPWMTKVMGAAHLSGLQGGALGGPDTYLNNFTHALVGTVKHYAAYGMSSGGIDGSPADLSEQKLREMYLAPFEYLADGRGLRSVMAAQNMVNGRPMHCNKRLLTDILRTEWNVTGENTVATVGRAALQARLIHWNLCAVCRCTGRVGRFGCNWRAAGLSRRFHEGRCGCTLNRIWNGHGSGGLCFQLRCARKCGVVQPNLDGRGRQSGLPCAP